MQVARRVRYLEPISSDMNFTQAAHVVGVSKCVGKARRNGRASPRAGTRNRPWTGVVVTWANLDGSRAGCVATNDHAVCASLSPWS